jgi:hypothetical protein
MTQRLGLYILFKRTLSVGFASLICSFLLIEGAWAQPAPPPDPAVPAGGPWGYLALIAAIAVYARWWSKRRSRNHHPEDDS